jgi:hypothetical protein
LRRIKKIDALRGIVSGSQCAYTQRDRRIAVAELTTDVRDRLAYG